MKFNLSLDKGAYRVTFTLKDSQGNSKRKIHYLKTSDEVIAQRLHRKMIYEFNNDCFDATLQSYTAQALVKPLADSILYVEPKLINLWTRYCKNSEFNSDREAVTRMIVKYGSSVLASEIKWFEDLALNYSPSTFGRRAGYLRGCLNWGITEGLYQGKNPYSNLRFKGDKDRESKIKPFELEEIQRIIEALRTDTYWSGRSGKHSDYLPFVQFLFATGVRIGEAVGLKWEKIDFKNKRVLINESLSRQPLATGVKWSKTKTKNSGYVPLNDSLIKVLEELKGNNPELKETDLVFLINGKLIDSTKFRLSCWRVVLAGLGIEYRYPYQTRHTLLSAIAKTGDLPLAAKIGRHKDLTMVMKHYGKHTGTDSIPDLLS